MTGLPQFAAARAVLERGVAGHVFPGAAWGVLLDGRVLACEGVGRLTYAEDSTATGCGTVYDLASVTKVMATTAVAMVLWQGGKLDLEQPLAEVLPEFASEREEAEASRRRITLRMLLAHTSGLPAHRHLYADASVYAARPGGEREAAMAAILAMPLEAEAGARAEYSDIGFILLGSALERIAGMTLPQMFQGWIAAPLGLEDSGFAPAGDGALTSGGPTSAHLRAELGHTIQRYQENVAPTRDLHWRKRTLAGEVHDENCALLGGAAGHAGLFSTVPDVLRFADAVLRPEVSGVFTADAVRLFTARQTGLPQSSRALGWDTPSLPSQSGRLFGPRSVGHLGFSGTSLWLDLDRRLAVALLTNRVYTDGDGEEPSRRISEVRPDFHDCLLEALQG